MSQIQCIHDKLTHIPCSCVTDLPKKSFLSTFGMNYMQIRMTCALTEQRRKTTTKYPIAFSD